MTQKKKKIPPVGYGPFDFVNVGLAVAESRISMDTFADYIVSMHPPSHKGKGKGKGKKKKEKKEKKNGTR